MRSRAALLWFVILMAFMAGVSIAVAGIRGRQAAPGPAPSSSGPAEPGQASDCEVRFDTFTGAPLGIDEQPAYLGIVVENSPAARPLSGIEHAAIVYEVPAEGGITRFLALFSRVPAGPVGPVRSVRPYIVELAASHGVVLTFCGGSPDALDMIRRMKYPGINELARAAGFYRDSARRAPHNLYASPDALMRRIAGAGFSVGEARTGFVYDPATGADSEHRAQGLSARMGVQYTVKWAYSPESGVYLRSVNGNPDVDRSGVYRMAAENVAVVFTPTRVLDAEGRLAVKLEGAGRAVVASGGSITEAKWERASGQPLRLITEAGGDVTLRTGRTWIHVVDTSTRLDLVED